MFISFCTLINYCSYSWPFKNISPWNYLGNISLFITIWSKNMLRTLLINCQCNEYTKVCLCISPPPLFCNHRLLTPMSKFRPSREIPYTFKNGICSGGTRICWTGAEAAGSLGDASRPPVGPVQSPDGAKGAKLPDC